MSAYGDQPRHVRVTSSPPSFLPPNMQSSPTHTRSSSFFSFFANKQSDSARHYRTVSQDVPPQPGPPQPQPQSQPQPQTQSPPPTQQLHPEIRSVVQLNHAHAHKVYFSGPLIRRLEFNPGGQKPIKDDGWTEIWAQLGGTTLSVWDMKEIEVASKQGKEVPPAYINVTDAVSHFVVVVFPLNFSCIFFQYIQLLGSVTAPATATSPSRRYSNVLTVNTAGANLYLFSCQTTAALQSWAAALRLASWEKSRLDEIYTAHLIRITLTCICPSTYLFDLVLICNSSKGRPYNPRQRKNGRMG
jgi:CCR4-NOT transcriptional complex subunit CAF120